MCEYLNLICLACDQFNGNKGMTRKDVWQFIMKNFDYYNYYDFLTSINMAKSEGKLEMNSGIIFVQRDYFKATFEEREKKSGPVEIK